MKQAATNTSDQIISIPCLFNFYNVKLSSIMHVLQRVGHGRMYQSARASRLALAATAQGSKMNCSLFFQSPAQMYCVTWHRGVKSAVLLREFVRHSEKSRLCISTP
ncbi:Uncharacterized protein HZ326_8529 [Fusarium oxysporum f. sp. albedinis]|nr:Uncharacterized protein HZ326_8529 [Fusarium oxysporum f. sp. albedinis]